ncbi:helix-turn-helix transcriptional regulator [Agreia pratensis]|nr:helix-turn-helix transcriptional regulator [Agreia pratensis]
MSVSSSPLGQFLRARRELVQPEDVGLPREAARRVPGLRREEVAARADISPEYYLRIEQGRDRRPSEQVVRSLARALLLDDNGLSYLSRLARPRPYLRAVRASTGVSDSVTRLLERWKQTPAAVTDANLDVLASNTMARLIAPGVLVPGTNLLEAAYDELTMTTLMHDATGHDQGDEQMIREYIAALRFNGDPHDARLQDVVGRLSTRHLSFRRIWAEYDAKPLSAGVSTMLIEPFGTVSLTWQTLGIPLSPGQFLTTYMAEPGSRAAAVLDTLSSSASSGGESPMRRLESALVLGGRDREARDERAS